MVTYNCSTHGHPPQLGSPCCGDLVDCEVVRVDTQGMYVESDEVVRMVLRNDGPCSGGG